MEYLKKLPNPITTSAKEIFAMEQTHHLTKDMEAHDLALIAYLDLINYQNGHSFEPPIMTRNAMFWMGMSLPPLAYIDPKKTRQSIYYLYSAHNNIAKPYLSDFSNPMESLHMPLLQKAMSAVLYRMISGRNDLDIQLKQYVLDILEIFQQNAYKQKVWGIDTVIGEFEPFPTLLGLLILTLYDKVFKTSLSTIHDHVMEFINETMISKQTGLFYHYYNTGYMGYPGEVTSNKVVWHLDNPSPANIAIALPIYHYFEPEKAKQMWELYKQRFLTDILQINASQIANNCGSSFITPLSLKGEAFLSALLCAKDFEDINTFELIQKHLYQIGNPNLWQGQVHYVNFGKYAHFIGAFAYLSRIHISWNKLLKHNWEKYEKYDYFTK